MDIEQFKKGWKSATITWWDNFLSQTDYQAYQPYSNGFIGVGILKKAENHEKEGVNEIVFIWHLTFEKVRDSYGRIAVTEDEANHILKNLKDVLTELEKRKK